MKYKNEKSKRRVFKKNVLLHHTIFERKLRLIFDSSTSEYKIRNRYECSQYGFFKRKVKPSV